MTVNIYVCNLLLIEVIKIILPDMVFQIILLDNLDVIQYYLII